MLGAMEVDAWIPYRVDSQGLIFIFSKGLKKELDSAREGASPQNPSEPS